MVTTSKTTEIIAGIMRLSIKNSINMNRNPAKIKQKFPINFPKSSILTFFFFSCDIVLYPEINNRP
jgi:hypothetical protein